MSAVVIEWTKRTFILPILGYIEKCCNCLLNKKFSLKCCKLKFKKAHFGKLDLGRKLMTGSILGWPDAL